MRIKSGNIPKELTYIVGPSRKIVISWEDVELEEGETDKVEEVFPTFVSDSSNAKTIATGRSWASQTQSTWDPATSRYIAAAGHTPTEITRSNDPITKLRIFGLDVRGNGGRAWKCADEEGHYFDLREDVLLDLMRTVGVSEGGYLNGEYIWAKIHAEMRLVRVGSGLHSALEVCTERREMKPISKKDLKPWHLYQKKDGSVFLHVGKACGFEPKTDPHLQNNVPVMQRWAEWLSARDYDQRVKAAPAQPPSWYGNNTTYIQKYKNLNEPPRPPRMVIDYVQYEKPLWIPVTWDDAKSVSDNIKLLENKKESMMTHAYYSGPGHLVTFSQDLKVVNEIGKLEIPSIFEQIRLSALKYIKENEGKGTYGDLLTTERNRLVSVSRMLEYGTINPADTEMDPSYDFWITEIISKEPK